MSVFVDTFAFIAWLNLRDSDHARVKAYFSTYSGPLVSTEWVLLELADALAAPAGRAIVVPFLRALRTDPQFEIIPYDPQVYQAGFDLFTARPDKDWPLTDCISFAVMSERSLTDAATADHHFEQAGFHPIFKAS